ncbi:MAG TPA: lamin tail domain-containing protein, partial [Chthoniobacteraceae bacterium]|nr:lamin tail domain-containing protein [Chthoniobacteraceae bacterium]
LDTLQNGVSNSEGATIPNTPTITFSGNAGSAVNSLSFSTSGFVDPQGAGTFAAMQWRMAEVNPSAAYVPGEKRLLEILASYDSGEIVPFASQFRFPASACVPGKRYRARVRHKDNTGRWSHWSAPVEFTAGTADVSLYKSSLVISELMYHPADPTAEESLQGWAEEDFEYIELRNVSALAVELTDVRFTEGVHFDFPNGAVLQAGATTLVVRNSAAFAARHGAGKPVAGPWRAADSLSNGGENLVLSFGAEIPIIEFDYDDASPWPVAADGSGPSLVLLRPETIPDHDDGRNWRASYAAGGSPGSDDRVTFASWSTNYPGVIDRNADTDFDGLNNGLEYALSGDPLSPSVAPQPQVAIQTLAVGGVSDKYLTLTFRRPFDPADVTYEVQFSDDFTAWIASGALVGSLMNPDGTATEVWRSATPASGAKRFARLKTVFK